MSSARTVTIELREDQAKWVDERIAAGAFSDESAAVREALDELVLAELERDVVYEEPTDDEIRAAVEPVLERIRNGTAVFHTLDEVFDRVSERYAERKLQA